MREATGSQGIDANQVDSNSNQNGKKPLRVVDIWAGDDDETSEEGLDDETGNVNESVVENNDNEEVGRRKEEEDHEVS